METGSQLICNLVLYEKMANAVNPYGDGNASRRIVDTILWTLQMDELPEDF